MFFFVSVTLFWFEMACGEFSVFGGVNQCPNNDIWGKLFKGPHPEGHLTPPRPLFGPNEVLEMHLSPYLDQLNAFEQKKL